MIVENWVCNMCNGKQQPRLVAVHLNMKLPEPCVDYIVIRCPKCGHIRVMRAIEIAKEVNLEQEEEPRLRASLPPQ